MTARTSAAARVLIVDDVEELRALYRFILDRKAPGEFEVVGEAEDGRAAIDLARRTQPDLVILDISMPIMDGLEALPGILRESPRSRVVMLSGFDAQRLARTALDLGATAYLVKGVGPVELVEGLRRAIRAPLPPRPWIDERETERPARRWRLHRRGSMRKV